MKTFFKNRFASTLFSSVLLTGVFSCNQDLLEPIPKTSFSDLVVFDTPERIVQQINGLYDGMKSGQFLGGRYFVYIEVRADEFLNETTNGVTALETWRHTQVATTNEVNNLWAAAYAAINRANLFLEGIDANEAKYVPPVFPANFASTTVPQYKAEARFLRALAYHSLLQLYARPYADGNGSRLGLPLRLSAEKSSANNDLARSTVAEVYAQILDDLTYAEQNLPTDYGDDYLNTTRAHRNTAIALKTRVYLHMQDYGNVITEANKIVSANAPFVASSGVPHALQDDFIDVFSPPYTTTESIFSMPFTPSDLPGTQNGLGSYFNPGPAGIGDYSLNPNGIYGNFTAWPADDERREMTSEVSGKPYLRKWPSGPQHVDYAPVIRYAEVLLNLAEALARSTGTVDARAVALVNAVRQRSDADFTHAPANNQELIDAIMLERRIELLGEGFRSSDFTRNLMDIPGKASVGSVPPSATIYIWPIPITELNANNLMVGND